MSQHRFPVQTSTGRAVEVLIGYDRPLHGFFLVVTATALNTAATADAHDDDDDEAGDVFIYSNLDDVDLIDLGGLTNDLEYFKGKLTRLGIALPPSIERELHEDHLHRVGNRACCYDGGGVLLPKSEG
jgi:hypothetical protein